jgi:hypothetical protein
MRERERQQLENADSYQRAADPLMQELASIGMHANSLGELRQSGVEYTAAIPILLEWLPRVTSRQVKEEIVRTLSVPWASPVVASALVAEFIKADDPVGDGLRWAIANGLAVTADDTVFEDVVRLVQDTKYGKAREMLALALGNSRNPRAATVLISLLGDEQVVGHAVMALGKLKSTAARASLEGLQQHPTEWVRTEVTKALAGMDSNQSALH